MTQTLVHGGELSPSTAAVPLTELAVLDCGGLDDEKKLDRDAIGDELVVRELGARIDTIARTRSRGWVKKQYRLWAPDQTFLLERDVLTYLRWKRETTLDEAGRASA